MESPLVSIIVPIYNAAMDMVPCLESIKRQRYQNLEVLLVNRAYKDFKSDDNGQNLLRQAISYAINRSELISSAYQNMATVAYTPIPSGTWLSNESTIRDIYDPLMAASLLDSAGYKLADDGNRYKDGKLAFPLHAAMTRFRSW